jgi:hypothetical protein
LYPCFTLALELGIILFGIIISVTPVVPVVKIFKITSKSLPTASTSGDVAAGILVICVTVF